MGLSDILTGMQHGPRGAPKPSSGGSGGGMSPLTMALLGLLAYKAIKSFGGGHAATAPSAGAPPAGGTTTAALRAAGSATSSVGCSAESQRARPQGASLVAAWPISSPEDWAEYSAVPRLEPC